MGRDGVSKGILAGALVLAVVGTQRVAAGQQGLPDAPGAGATNVAQQSIPDAPNPRNGLPAPGSVAPGIGSTSSSGEGDTAAPAEPTAAPTPAADEVDKQPPVDTESRQAFTLTVQANFVDIPFTVKDSKGNLIPGLTARDVRVYENGVLQHITNFTVDPYPLSVAVVVDQSMSQDNMTRVNDALGALQGAFAAYDELAVFTYNNGPKMVTDFTASQSARLTQSIELSKGTGREALMAGSLSGPLAQNTIVNNQQFDPNTSANRGHSTLDATVPREVHTLNDAILDAATALTRTPRDRRRIIFVISDGKEYGSKAKMKDVIQYLETNKIAVWGTLVGDSSLPVVGFLDRIHIPLQMRDNVLPVYAVATGGNIDPEFRTARIEASFAAIAKEARTQYTLGYYTHEPFIDGKYRRVEVRVLRPNLTVIAKQGYYPSAMDTGPVARPAQPAK